MSVLLELKNVSMTYHPNTIAEVKALSNIELIIEQGQFLSIMGTSGSGKTTFLNIISTIRKPTSGTVYYKGQSIFDMDEEDKAKYRYQTLSFVFQDFNLISSMTIKENIELPLMMNHKELNKSKEELNEIVKDLQIENILNKYTVECSGGQLQRAAIARAIIAHSPIIICDEPTGNLDTKTAQDIMELLVEINKRGTTVILVTHDSYMASYSDRLLTIEVV